RLARSHQRARSRQPAQLDVQAPVDGRSAGCGRRGARAPDGACRVGATVRADIISSSMSAVHAFRAVRPRPSDAARVAAVPYDVVSTAEARALAADNPLSFLHVSRAETELADTDPYSDIVYARAAENYTRLQRETLVVEAEPALYLYRLRMGSHEQTGVAACYSLGEYDHDLIRKHE